MIEFDPPDIPDEELLQGLSDPTPGCAVCEEYRAEILRLRKLVATPLTMLCYALNDVECGLLTPALEILNEWDRSLGEDDGP